MAEIADCMQEHLDIIRDESISRDTFRRGMSHLARGMARAAFHPPYQESENLVVVPILRAGLGMLDGVLGVLHKAEVGFLGIERLERDTLEHIFYLQNIPDMEGKTAIILDPMLATGGSAIIAARRLKKAGAAQVIILCAIAAPEGLNAVTVADPDVTVIPAAVDDGLDDNAYIVPGLGDAGDRLYGKVI